MWEVDIYMQPTTVVGHLDTDCLSLCISICLSVCLCVSRCGRWTPIRRWPHWSATWALSMPWPCSTRRPAPRSSARRTTDHCASGAWTTWSAVRRWCGTRAAWRAWLSAGDRSSQEPWTAPSRCDIPTCVSAFHHHHHHCVAGEGRHVTMSTVDSTLPEVSNRTGGIVFSWSSHLFHGRPGGRRHVRSGGRLSDTSMWSRRAMFAGVSSSSRASTFTYLYTLSLSMSVAAAGSSRLVTLVWQTIVTPLWWFSFINSIKYPVDW